MQKLVDRLRAMCPGASGRTLKQLLEHGRVLVDGAVVRRGDRELSPEADVRIASKATPRDVLTEAPIKIMYEDESLVVIDKPPGLLTVSERADGRPSAWSVLRSWYAERGKRTEPMLVHRLDATASGLLVFAKSEAVARSLKDLFASHVVDRHYAAVVEGALPGAEGVCESALVESMLPPHRVRSLRPNDGEEAHGAARASLTRWRRLASRGALHALEVRLETGRKHQIRVHLAEAGFPIVGDELYGGRKHRRLLLHAWVLGFLHPRTGLPIRCTARPGPSFDVAGRDAYGGEPTLRPLETGPGAAEAP
jgi:23S rRNA pseudouridine1911/1915/1917 synthase